MPVDLITYRVACVCSGESVDLGGLVLCALTDYKLVL